FGNRNLCGIQLVEALLLVCGGKGLFYQHGRPVREDNIGLHNFVCVCLCCVCLCVCKCLFLCNWVPCFQP
uniref:Insulin-like domain-containing protein n=1 Tax=Oncorhynchus mykiss TaxID=8022 RepID=A0A8C7V2Q2_ONCMY